MSISFEVLSIILINSIVSFKGFNDNIFFNNFHFKIDKIKTGEYFRLISSGFLHVDKQHLLFNMVTLYFFGDFVLNMFGSFWFFSMLVEL